MKKKEFAILLRTRPAINSNGKLTTVIVEINVEVMARAKGYAMVRRPGSMPFVEPEKYLHSLPVEIKPGA